MNEIEIRLFGAMRNYSVTGRLMVRAEEGARAGSLRAAIARTLRERDGSFDGEELLADSALATESGLLAGDAPIR